MGDYLYQEESGRPIANLGRHNVLPTYANDAAFEAVFGSGQENDRYWNTTINAVREHSGTAWRTVGNPISGDLYNFKIDNDVYAIASGTVYTVEGAFRFHGTNVHTPVYLKIVAARVGTAGTSYFRLYDATNAQQISEISLTAAGIAIYSNTLSNLPASEAIFEIQGYKDAGGSSNGYLYSVQLTL